MKTPLLFLLLGVMQNPNPLSAGAKHTYELVRGYLTQAITKMPEEFYGFRPVPEERSFAQIVGHLADANGGLCAVVSGQRPPTSGNENGKTTKADLVKALNDAFTFCDQVYASMTDDAGKALVRFTAGGAIERRPEEMSKLSTLEYNTHHDFDHYGNMAIYMRLKGVVPPSSDTTTQPILDRKAITVSTRVLDQYAGTYQISATSLLIITRQGDQLYGEITGRGAIPLFAETETRFFSKVVNAQLDFVKDEKGVFSKAVVHLNGVDQQAVKK